MRPVLVSLVSILACCGQRTLPVLCCLVGCGIRYARELCRRLRCRQGNVTAGFTAVCLRATRLDYAPTVVAPARWGRCSAPLPYSGGGSRRRGRVGSGSHGSDPVDVYLTRVRCSGSTRAMP